MAARPSHLASEVTLLRTLSKNKLTAGLCGVDYFFSFLQNIFQIQPHAMM